MYWSRFQSGRQGRVMGIAAVLVFAYRGTI
jgi:hypothetical protein